MSAERLVIEALVAPMTTDELRYKARYWREHLGDVGAETADVLEDVIKRRERLAWAAERAS